jgi:Arc/MetJ family transcription regulator
MRDAVRRRAGRRDLNQQAEADEPNQREGLCPAMMAATGIA